ncbi:MAG: acyl carrier protein [Oscillospiraceae bacterium]|jgi:acyl carrier protein|nr:acyl carrier protein [Oscillospiraceae bacterium]
MPDIFERMQTIIADQFSVNPDDITADTSFEDDLGADSVDLVELVMSMEEEFEIGEVLEEELATLSTVGDCVEFLTNKLEG